MNKDKIEIKDYYKNEVCLETKVFIYSLVIGFLLVLLIVIMNLLKKDLYYENNLIIESKYNGILCEFDLLIASQYLIYHIGKILNIDVSKPKYSENAMKIYFYKGKL